MKNKCKEKWVDMKLHLDADVDKLLHEGAARAGVLPEDLARSILITDLAKPEQPKTPIPNISLFIFDQRVQELMTHALLGTSDQLLRDIEAYSSRMKHYGHTPEWSGKPVILETAKKMQLLARIVPELCRALDKADTLGGKLKWTVNVERES